MLECRYYGNCYFMECDVPDKCDGYGNCESYRHSHKIKTMCQFYKPMPDVDAILELADGLEKDADNIISAARNAKFTGSGPRMEEAKHDAYDWRQIAARIREACGEAGR